MSSEVVSGACRIISVSSSISATIGVVEIPPPPHSDALQIEKLKELSYFTYGKTREEIESEIEKKYRKG